MDRRTWIIIGILIVVGLGLLFVSNMTGHVITGMAVEGSGSEDMVIESENFRISDFGAGDSGGLNEDGVVNG